MANQQKNRTLSADAFPDYPYHPNFVEIDALNIHYIDEGKKDGLVILFLHGVPTWSYTFRKIFPSCLDAGLRIIAPDLPGFGKSTHPRDKSVFTVEKLVNIVADFIRCLKIKQFVVFGHDWGALLAMVLAAKIPEYFLGMILCNGMLPVIGQQIPFQFNVWKWFSKYSPILFPGRIVDFASLCKLTKKEREGYDYPFPTPKEKNAIRILPGKVPLRKGDEGAELVSECWKKLAKWETPTLTVFSDKDAITRGSEKIIQQRIPGAKNQSHQILSGKHFLQEDKAAELGKIIVDFALNSLGRC